MNYRITNIIDLNIRHFTVSTTQGLHVYAKGMSSVILVLIIPKALEISTTCMVTRVTVYIIAMET